jgi:serine/threonine-protein kinase PpkA
MIGLSCQVRSRFFAANKYGGINKPRKTMALIDSIPTNLIRLLLSFILVVTADEAVSDNHSLTKPNSPDKSSVVALSLKKAEHLNMNLAPKTVVISAGCFTMGSQEQELGRQTDELQHRVCVKTFKMTPAEVTVAEFQQFVTATKYITDAERNVEESGCWSYQKDPEQAWDWLELANWRQPVHSLATFGKSYPVACVSYNDVQAFIHWLNQATDQEYRLPTEAEWEFAARANTLTSRYWGNSAAFACANENVADTGLFEKFKWTQSHTCVDGYFFSAPVKHYRPNPFGLFDMLGNLMEWTCSMYAETYAGAEASCVDEANALDRTLVIRGGAWHADPARVRSAFRNTGLAWTRQANLGFRLVRIR